MGYLKEWLLDQGEEKVPVTEENASFVVNKIRKDPNYSPYCLKCVSMNRMQRNDLDFCCKECGHRFTVD